MSNSKVINELPNSDKRESQAIQEQLDKLRQAEEGTTHEPIKTTKYPTLIVDLPSRGHLYTEADGMADGTVEMKYMTAKEEDILTTESYVKKGIVLDKFFQSLIVSRIKYENMLISDLDALMISARIYGYGENYTTKVRTPSGNIQDVPIDLSNIKPKELHEDFLNATENRFTFESVTGEKIEFKLLTNKDQKVISNRRSKAKHGDQSDRIWTSRLNQMILSIDGNDDKNFIRLFVDNQFRAIDSKRLRNYIKEIQPAMDMEIEVVDEATGEPFRSDITIRPDFLWANI